jgi:hypothetical protein
MSESWEESLDERLRVVQARSGEFLKLLAADPPETIFHYTSPRGFLGILESGTVWATNARFLNDRSELVYAEGIISSAALALDHGKRCPAARQLIQALQRPDWRGSDPKAVFVACFSANEDSLSQWRAYADDGVGYALGFPTDQPFHVKGRPSIHAKLLRVFYEREAQEALARKALAPILDALEACPASADPGRAMFRALVAVLVSVVPLGIAMKNGGFQEESEWRLVVVDVGSLERAPNLRHRPSRFGLTPFVELVAGERLPLRRLVLGPQLHEQPARIGSLSFLGARGYNYFSKAPDMVVIVDSQATYRGGRG